MECLNAYYMCSIEWEELAENYSEPYTVQFVVVASNATAALRMSNNYLTTEFYGHATDAWEPETFFVLKEDVTFDCGVYGPQDNQEIGLIVQDDPRVDEVAKHYAWRKYEPLWVTPNERKARYIILRGWDAGVFRSVDFYKNSSGRSESPFIHGNKPRLYTLDEARECMKKIAGDFWWHGSTNNRAVFEVHKVYETDDGGIFGLMEFVKPLTNGLIEEGRRLGLYFAKRIERDYEYSGEIDILLTTEMDDIPF